MTAERCTMPTARLSICSRPATYRYVSERSGTSADPDIVVAACCAQHDRATNHAALLRVRPWE